MANTNTAQTATPVNGVKILRKGSATRAVSEIKPPDAMLAEVEPGTVVETSDKVQWIAMAAVPARWERTKRPIKVS